MVSDGDREGSRVDSGLQATCGYGKPESHLPATVKNRGPMKDLKYDTQGFVQTDVKDRFKDSWACKCHCSWKHFQGENRCPGCGWDRIKMITASGKQLLKLFREEQAKKDNYGCTCSTCQGNMSNALKRFKELEDPL